MIDITADIKLRNEIREAYMDHTGNSEVDYASREWLDFEGGWFQCLRATPAPQAAPSDKTAADRVRTLLTEQGIHMGADFIKRLLVAAGVPNTPLGEGPAAPAVAITQAATSALPQWIEDRKGRDPETDALIEYIIKQQAATSEPVACVKCSGTGVVDDGEIDCYPNGEPYLCGPVKCVKDCAHCSGTGRAPAAAPVAHLAGTTPNTEAPSDVLAPSSKEEVAAFEAWAAGEKYDMTTHPLHWLFLNERTGAARQGWKAALKFARAALSAQQAGVKVRKLVRWTFDTGMTASVRDDGQWVLYKDLQQAGLQNPCDCCADIRKAEEELGWMEQAGVQEAPSKDAKDERSKDAK